MLENHTIDITSLLLRHHHRLLLIRIIICLQLNRSRCVLHLRHRLGVEEVMMIITPPGATRYHTTNLILPQIGDTITLPIIHKKKIDNGLEPRLRTNPSS